MPDESDIVPGKPDLKGITVIGLVSDTHGLLWPEVLEAFRNVTGIIHVGDVGRPEILKSLQELAPTVFVRGNVDTGAWAKQLPLSVTITIGSIRVYVYHGHEAPELDPAKADCQVVVSGHSHKPKNETRDGVLYLNPGGAGPGRFKLPITLMRRVRQVILNRVGSWGE